MAALERAAPGCTGCAGALLRSLEAPADALLTTLVNGLAELPHHLVLALDDLHHMTDETLQRTLAELVAHAPSRLRFILISRHMPSLPLSRLRARGQLLEIGVDDLRFTSEEVAAFLTYAMRISIAPREAAALAVRAEGWVARLQHAALALRDRSDLAAVLNELSGDNRYIIEYLSDEVIDCQPYDLYSFLLRIAVLDRLCAPLCAAVTEEADATAMLRRIERASLFLQPLDTRSEWHRFHALFAQALRRKLRETSPDLLAALHQRASAWHEQAGLLEQATRHSLAAGDTAHATDLAERHAANLWQRSEMGQLSSWLNTLPEPVTRESARLLVYRVWALFVAGEFTDGSQLLETAERYATAQLTEAERRTIGGALMTLRGFLARCETNHGRSTALARAALEMLPADDLTWRSLAAICLGHTAIALGNLDAAERAYAEAAANGERAGDTFVMLTGTLGMANVKSERADLRAVERLSRTTYEHVTTPGWPPLPVLGYVEAMLVLLAYKWNRLAEAEAYAQRRLERGDTSMILDLRVNGHIQLAWIARARGPTDEADRELVHATAAIASSGMSHFARSVSALRARFKLLRGNLGAADGWVHQLRQNRCQRMSQPAHRLARY